MTRPTVDRTHTDPTYRSARVALVGTGGRGLMYNRAVAQRDHLRLVGLLDPNPVRMKYHSDVHAAAGRDPVATYDLDGFDAMVHEQGVDTIVVTSVDRTHSDYIVAGLEAGLRVITEKPLTTDFDNARRILDTVERTGNHPTVTFNYRYSPIATTFSELIGSDAIGDVVSVHFEWLLDTSHGADYFRRWHRDKANSGGLMIHKASHHFDLINWSIRQQPDEVMGYGRLAFYGRENGQRLDLRRDYERAAGSPAAADDPFAIDLSSTEQHRDLYLAAEQADGYIRDQNVFGDGITIEDDMAVLVKYRQGAMLTYHLTAYSPWEGYRFMVNGTKGRLELENNESVWTRPRTGTSTPVPAIHGAEAAENAGGARILLRPQWQPPREVPVVFDHAGHGGGDVRLLTDLFGPEPGSEIAPSDPALRLQAGEVDGMHAMGIGAAANIAFGSGQPVRIAEALGREI